jgi:hypothetical protein
VGHFTTAMELLVMLAEAAEHAGQVE